MGIIFARRHYREWFLYLDDLSVATGRKFPHNVGPSRAEDVWGSLYDSSATLGCAAVATALSAFASRPSSDPSGEEGATEGQQSRSANPEQRPKVVPARPKSRPLGRARAPMLYCV